MIQNLPEISLANHHSQADKEPPKQFVRIQYLRAVAALMVVFLHSQFVHQTNWGRNFGGLGVDLFFGISGFVIYAVTLRDFSLRAYLLKRCIRIIPIYWGLTCLFAALVLAAPHLIQGTVFRFDHFLSSLFFIPTYTPSRPNEITPLLPPGWTLNYEMFFYVVFGVLLFVLKSRALVLIALTLLFGALVFAGTQVATENPIVLTYTSRRLLEFLAGVYAAYLLLHLPQHVLPRLVVWAMIAASWALLMYVGMYLDNTIVLVAAIFLAVYGTAALDLVGQKPAHWFPRLVGDASYSIYLIQVFTLGLVKYFFLRLTTITNSPWQALGFVTLCMSVTTMAGICLYLYFEVPVLRFLRSKLVGKSEQGDISLTRGIKN